MVSFAPVRALTRGLNILELVARLPAPVTLTALSQASGLSKPTALRLLETLAAEGYVVRASRGRTYHLTDRVRRLGVSFDAQSWLVAVAEPLLDRLCTEIGWPSDLAVFDGQGMLIRTTNRSMTALSVNRELVGYRPPMLLSAVGRAYLAWCPPGEREDILARHGSAQQRTFRPVLEETRRRGYAVRDSGLDPPTGAIAVALCSAGQVLACLSVVFIQRAVAPEQVAAQCLAPLRRTCHDILRQVQAQGH